MSCGAQRHIWDTGIVIYVALTFTYDCCGLGVVVVLLHFALRAPWSLKTLRNLKLKSLLWQQRLFKSSLSLCPFQSLAPSPKLKLKPIREELENTHTHTDKTPLPTCMHTCCTRTEWNRSAVPLHSSETTLGDWEKRERETKRERVRKHLHLSTSGEHQCGGIAWSVQFQVRPFSSYKTMEAKKWRSGEVKVHLVTEQQTRVSSGITGLCMCSCHSDIFSYPSKPSFDWSPSVCRIFSPFFLITRVCAAAGNMSNGCSSHLLRGAWLLWLWQGKTTRLVSRIWVTGLRKIYIFSP